MQFSEIRKIIIATQEAHFGSFDAKHPESNKNFAANFARDPIAYRCGPNNWSNMDCNNEEIMKFALTHAEYSHFSIRGSGSCQYCVVYWHEDGSPTGVGSVGTFAVENVQQAYAILKDPIGAALAWGNGY